jgi:hypothetical protein
MPDNSTRTFSCVIINNNKKIQCDKCGPDDIESCPRIAASNSLFCRLASSRPKTSFVFRTNTPSPLPFCARIFRAAIIVEHGAKTRKMTSSHAALQLPSLLHPAGAQNFFHANGGRPAQGGKIKCCRFCSLNRSVWTQSIVKPLQPRRSSEICAECYTFKVQERHS